MGAAGRLLVMDLSDDEDDGTSPPISEGLLTPGNGEEMLHQIQWLLGYHVGLTGAKPRFVVVQSLEVLRPCWAYPAGVSSTDGEMGTVELFGVPVRVLPDVGADQVFVW